MTQKFSNAARAYLASGISDSATSITVTTGTGATFPEITSPDFARAVLQDANGIEIVLIIAHAAGSDSFTVTRAQESTAARAFSAGAVFGLRVTAADAASFAAKQEYLVSGTNIKTINGTSVLGAGNIQIDGGVTSFNTRTGAITLGSSDVTGALGYTPYNSTNPSGYITGSSPTITTPVITENVQVINTNTTAVRSRVYVLTASLTLTLPATPAAGDWVKVQNSSGTTTAVIARNGSNIMSLAENMTLDANFVSVTLVYADATRGWVIAL